MSENDWAYWTNWINTGMGANTTTNMDFTNITIIGTTTITFGIPSLKIEIIKDKPLNDMWIELKV
jgi:hypothetical protein